MADISASARASVNGTGTKNVQFAPVSTNLESRVVLALGYDPLKTAVVDNVLTLLTSVEDASSRFGFGSEIHRAAIRQYSAHEFAIPVYALPLPASGGAAATGTVTFAVNATSSGTMTFRIAGDIVTISVTTGDTPTDIGDALVTAITNDPDLPVTAVNAVGVVTLTAKWVDSISDDITIKYNLTEAETEAAPGGTTVAIVAMSGGSGTSDITDALTAITSSSIWFTDVIFPYNDVTTFDEVETAIGDPQTFTGLYSKLDYRPLTSWSADVTAGSAGLNAAVAIGAARKSDAVNDYIQAPDYIEPPFEIASYYSGIVALQANNNPASHYEGLSASALYGPEDTLVTSDWTSSYTNRDTAVKNGLSVLYLKNGAVVLGDACSFYHPDGIANPAYLFEVNKRKTWNIAKDVKADKDDPERQGSVLVENASAATDQSKATDTDIESSRIVALSDLWYSRGLIYNSVFTKQNTIVTIDSQNPDRINREIKVLLSGNARIRDDEIQLDRNINLATTILISS
jgi:phage tail sheath gpL-like